MNVPVKPPLFELPDTGLVIDGKIVRATSLGRVPHVNPATGRTQAEVPIAGAPEGQLAVAAAKCAWPGWRATPPAERRDRLFRLADLVLREKERFAWIGAMEVGT